MKINFWIPVIIVFGIVSALAIICLTVFNLRKLELGHQETMADKDLTREMLSQSISSSTINIGHWQTCWTTIKKTLIEICPSFVTKLLGF